MLKRTLLSLVILLSCGGDKAAGPTGPQPPAKPANAMTIPGAAEIVLHWQDVANETHYEVQFRPAAQQSWLLLPNVPANSTSAKHTAVEKNVNYFYRVAACNAVGCSEPAETSGQWSILTGPPTLLTSDVYSIGGYEAGLSATARSGGVAVSFLFTLTKAGETVPFYSETVVSAPPLNGDGDYVVTATKRYNLLQHSTDYVLNVLATNQFGSGGTVAPKSFRTRSPTPPIINRLSAGSTTFVAWIIPNGFDTDYAFQLVRAGESFASPLGTSNGHTLGSNSEAFASNSGLAALGQSGVTYNWRVVATNEAGTTISPTQTWTAP